MPEADQEIIRSNGAEYIAAGFPWVIMSLDVVHIRLWGCSANLKQVSTGKEKFPSRAFELGCNNRRIIVSAKRGFYGSVTDKSIVKFDGAVNSVRGGKYDGYVYDLYDIEGNVFSAKGGAILLDNGYLQIPCMMEPSKWASSQWEIKWSEMAESLRKDIECLNGELKSGFGILKYGPRFGDLDLIDDIFLTCCALHNQRKIVSGLDEEYRINLAPPDLDSDMPVDEIFIQRRMNDLPYDDALNKGPGEHIVDTGAMMTKAEKLCRDEMKEIYIIH